MTSHNEELFAAAQKVIPGGVNSPVRAFRSVGGTPRFFTRGSGARMWDADGKEYIDYVGSWGPLILGHAHPAVIAAVQQAVARGLSFGAPTAAEVELAELLCKRVPGLEQVRLVSSGTEATMSAIRLARGFTGRSSIVKFEGCYHGHADALLVKAGSGALTFGNPSSAGVPAETAAHTQVLEYNNVAMLEATFAREGDKLACVIVEPVAGNMNLVMPDRAFLDALRTLCTRHGTLLILDEVMTGFRVGPKGAQGLFGITADLVTLGKIVGGGMPLGAFGGRRDVMASIAPLGPVYQAGTLSGNPVAVAAGLDPQSDRHAGVFRAPCNSHAQIDGRPGRRRARQRRRIFGAGDRRHVRPLFPRHAAVILCGSHDLRRASVQSLFSLDARARHLSRAIGVRSGLRLVRAQRRGYRTNAGGGAALFFRRRLSCSAHPIKKAALAAFFS